MLGLCGALLLAAAATPALAGHANLRVNVSWPRLAQLRRGGESSSRSLVALTEAHEYYHTTAEMAAEVRRLSKNCGGLMSINTVKEGDMAIDVAYVKKPGHEVDKRNRVSILTGEHARELIGPETVLHMLKILCGEVQAEGVDLDKVLHRNNFQVIFNANPHSRQKVEAGSYCIRANPNGVDLNRNYDEEFHSGEGGSKPFSEPETIIAKKMLSSYMPNTFLSIHSGTLGLYMPWAYSPSGETPNRNKVLMMQTLKTLDAKYCTCPYGAAGVTVGYPCPGTSVDWVYDKLGANFSFAWEVWVDRPSQEFLHSKWRQMQELGLLEISNHDLSSEHFRDFFEEHPSDFVRPVLAQKAAHLREDRGWYEFGTDCLEEYNPVTKSDYDEAVQNWAEAYLSAAELLGAHFIE